MKKRVLIVLIFLMFAISVLTSCDPIYPPGNLRVARIEPLAEGASVEIEIIYPNTGGSIVFGWKDQNIEILSGNDVITVSGLSITGIKSGTARVKVSATTAISDEASAAGHEERVYSVEAEIRVK